MEPGVAAAGRRGGHRPAPALTRSVAFAAGSLLFVAHALAQTPGENLKRARDAFEYGDYARVVQLAKGLPESGALPVEVDRIDAYRILGLSHFYLRQTTEAEQAFLGLLRQNPDYQLDPFYVPPIAVAFFDEIRKRNEPYLAPIRERRNRQVREEQAAERARAEEERRRREAESRPLVVEKPVPVYVDRQVLEHSRFVASMPFGLGQFQNGDAGLGVGLLAGQALSGALSVAAFVAIEALRQPDTGRFAGGDLGAARTFDAVKWIGAGLFYLLWAGGAADAHLRFVPSRLVEPPAAAPAAPLPLPRTIRPRLPEAPPSTSPPAFPVPPATEPAPPTLEAPDAPKLPPPAPRQPLRAAGPPTAPAPPEPEATPSPAAP